ncbi:acyl-CoA dehydrogenase family protein [Paenibacillus chitinolyticus]|uniref:acyl-CoA dehydrogenase family protein n=1 Tax=Paenibacillus chitinolyticus TaxID=79263 RepID=UPI0036DEADB2
MIFPKFELLEIKEQFKKRAAFYDQSKTFPYENFDLIVKKRLHTVNLEKKFGGLGIDIEETCDFIIELAEGCPSTALCLAMHYYSLGSFEKIMPHEMKEVIFNDVWKNGEFFASINQPNVLLNSLRNKPEDITSIRAKKTSGGYIISGQMFYVSGCLKAKYFPVYCLIESEGKINNNISVILLKKEDIGISIEDTWNFSGMRASKSHRINISDVVVPADRLIGREGYGIEDTQLLFFWFNLLLVSVYFGIAKSAYLHTLEVTRRKIDPISKKSVSLLPGTQFHIADIRMWLEVAYNQINTTARSVKEINSENFNHLYTQTLVTKLFVTEYVNKIVEECSKIEGMSSLKDGSLLERLNRDVKALLFHPPQEDIAKEILGKKSLGIISIRNRWL